MKNTLCFFAIIIAFTSKAQVSFTINPTICSNTSLVATAISGTSTVINYSWTSSPTGLNFSNQTASTTSIYFPLTGTFTVALNYTTTSGAGVYTNSLSVVASPTISVSQTSSISCIQSNAPLFSKPVMISLNGASSYTWQPALPPPLTGPNNGSVGVVRPSVNTCYTITGYIGLCSNMITTCITIKPQYTVDVSASGTVICFTPDGGEYVKLTAVNISTGSVGQPSTYTYSWKSPLIGSILTPPTLASVAVSPSATTIYTLEVRDSLGCVSLPALITISVLPCTGINTIENDLSIIVYPNPFNDKLRLELSSESILVKEIFIQNTLRQNFPVMTNGKGKPEINLSFLPCGVYYLNVTTNLGIVTTRIIKE